jgi:predicted hotdog family 3-hydroxylacyl-ACP dehydratase
MTAQQLDHAAIAARIPHAGRMCLLDSVLGWSQEDIRCSIVGHGDPAHPLRTPGGLLAPSAIEYAAQAMALHASLCQQDGQAPLPGFIASARNVNLHVARLDLQPGPLGVLATKLAGDATRAMYAFELNDVHGRRLVDGRVAVVLNSPLELASSTS